MNYAEIKYCDIANGPGVRTSIFVSGCTHRCKGCFNEIAWDFNYGKPFTIDTINTIIEYLEQDTCLEDVKIVCFDFNTKAAYDKVMRDLGRLSDDED